MAAKAAGINRTPVHSSMASRFLAHLEERRKQTSPMTTNTASFAA
jgi:hypothetical protein